MNRSPKNRPRRTILEMRVVEAVHRFRFLGHRARLTFTGEQLWIAYHARRAPLHLGRSQIRRVTLGPPTLGTRLWFLNQVVMGVLRVELVDGEPLEFLIQSQEDNFAANRGVRELGVEHEIDGRLRLPKGAKLDVPDEPTAPEEVPAALEPWLVWVDHRAAPDELVEDVEAALNTGSLRLELGEEEPPRGTLHHAGRRRKIAFEEDSGDVDRLLTVLRATLGPAFEFRVWRPSEADDTVGLLVAPAEFWSELDADLAARETRALGPEDRIFRD